ncbi:sterol carrier family protein [Demequina sp. TTPB684]|uniref:sterol carrier family protein n=1 Tax=unclassified Demequina TaxID=2620311 RepID=UPI001CF36F7E|nr:MULTISPECIES: sterol carrier family protein [unclassified Demequina]MCB2411732.1 sterol carrier family protein [Demequina sp. TTPB684]UPU87624.1 sterol carrier family protein [Demequina sp. TMPB413]
MAQRRISPSIGRNAVDQIVAARRTPLAASSDSSRVDSPQGSRELFGVDSSITATAVRYLLQELGERAPGRSVEVRVPPFGAVQCIEGTSHRRGTPPAVIEMDAETWVALCTGDVAWADAVREGKARASGERAELSGLLPLV